MEALIVLALVIGAAVAIYLASLPRRRKLGVEGLRRELEHLTHDRAAAERLVAAERERAPDEPEIEILRRVIRRLRHERRR